MVQRLLRIRKYVDLPPASPTVNELFLFPKFISGKCWDCTLKSQDLFIPKFKLFVVTVVVVVNIQHEMALVCAVSGFRGINKLTLINDDPVNVTRQYV